MDDQPIVALVPPVHAALFRIRCRTAPCRASIASASMAWLAARWGWRSSRAAARRVVARSTVAAAGAVVADARARPSRRRHHAAQDAVAPLALPPTAPALPAAPSNWRLLASGRHPPARSFLASSEPSPPWPAHRIDRASVA